MGEIVVSLVPIPITLAAVRSSRQSPQLMLAFWAVTVFLLLNGLNHIGQTLVFREYSPGTLTAAVLLLPSSFYLMRRSVREGWLEGWQLGLAASAGVITAPLAVLFFLIVGTLLARAFGQRGRLRTRPAGELRRGLFDPAHQ